MAVLLAFVTLTSSITAGVVFAAGPAAAHGDHTDGGGSDGSDEWAADSDSFRKETVISGLNQPMETVFLPDGRMLVIQKGGEIVIYDPGTEESETYLDLREIDSVESNRERGLLGIALANDFDESGEFYVYYSRLDDPDAADPANSEPENVLARFTHVENDGGTTSRADPASREVLWRNEIHTGSDIACCHLGGGLDVGPDGKVYIGTGDEYDNAQWAQDLSRPDGKIIRLNPDGSIPEDNPFAGDGDPDTLGEIWAYGLRNPYRINFAQNGELYIGEVGGNNRYDAAEDIHLGEKGANYGWPDCEGVCENPDYNDPIFSYLHGETPGGANDDPSGDGYGAAVTVGPVYGADMFPEEYDNVLFYSDYNDRLIKYLVLSDDGTEVVAGPYNFDKGTGALVSTKVGPDGALYGTQLGRGQIVRYVYESGNKAPQVDSASATPESGAAPLDVTFDASASDPEGDDLSYTWHFGDGETASGASISHTYDEQGSYEPYVEVSDGTTAVDSEPVPVSVGGAPEMTLNPSGDVSARGGEDVTLSADVTDVEDGRLSGEDIEWEVSLAHNTHRHPQTSETGESITYTVPATGHATTGVVAYEVNVTATDSDGLQTTKSVTIEPEEVDVTLASQPEGVNVSVGGVPESTADGGYTFDTMIGYRHSLSAPESVCREGTSYEFDGWSDGATDSDRTYTVPTADATLTAQYAEVGTCGGVAEENAPPEIGDIPAIEYTGEEVTVDVTEYATDPDGDEVDPSSVAIVEGAEEGSATSNGDGTVTYDTEATSGTDSFAVTVNDTRGGQSAPATVDVTIDVEDGDDGDTTTETETETETESGGGAEDGEDADPSGGDGDVEPDDEDEAPSGGSLDDENDEGGSDDADGEDDSDDGGSSGGSGGGYSGDAGETASFELSNATLSATNVSVGDAVNASAVVANVGDADGATTVDLTVGDETVDARELSLEAGASETVTLSHSFEESGTYELSLGGRSVGNVTVTDATGANASDEGDGSSSVSTAQTAGGDENGTADSEGGDGDAETAAVTDEATVTATETGADPTATGETNSGTPGFGPVVALLSVFLGAAAFARRRRT
ncbi:PQQ-dependent sugar dehydrogenase [Halogeometricum sp. S1BR25-6]|uniref:PQQ-dependent sugar dehydrogenase n=1 Tax=Halogeometricum salsisoli TaxID=2950536 RepID=A0ABU2GI14_9EURY|nr:PQQ-dependent sugar dehydrogenase [Halogeometricum sp. S1BR25-6]MDS0300453.1 PQQ-dependent sugar dehydrogenase [Halogeometricum sp. S1BR25-6]